MCNLDSGQKFSVCMHNAGKMLAILIFLFGKKKKEFEGAIRLVRDVRDLGSTYIVAEKEGCALAKSKYATTKFTLNLSIIFCVFFLGGEHASIDSHLGCN